MEVLVIDDTKNIRMLLTKCLEFEGYIVTTAGNGAEALDFISGKKFDLIFLDVRMPEISGTEVLRHIREMGVDTPVIMITAFGTVKNAVECTQLGAVTYLQKPFTENKIKQVLEEVLHFNSGRNSLDHILSLAEDRIKNNLPADAELLLKNSLPAYHLEPQLYRMLSRVYEAQGKPEDAQKCREISRLLQRNDP
ncbi:MAG: response regulator [Clostridia bacterium]|nr:response regulator [Clostridia bacterium]